MADAGQGPQPPRVDLPLPALPPTLPPTQEREEAARLHGAAPQQAPQTFEPEEELAQVGVGGVRVGVDVQGVECRLQGALGARQCQPVAPRLRLQRGAAVQCGLSCAVCACPPR